MICHNPLMASRIRILFYMLYLDKNFELGMGCESHYGLSCSLSIYYSNFSRCQFHDKHPEKNSRTWCFCILNRQKPNREKAHGNYQQSSLLGERKSSGPP